MDEDDPDHGFGPDTRSAEMACPPTSVSLIPFRSFPSPSPRRLSSIFIQPSKPVSSARKLAWVSLQGRVVNAEEASSARAIKGGLSRGEAVAWQLFPPIQRFLIVAVIGVAVAESKKNRLISQLKKSVQIRDQVLLSMQLKLDNLCEELYYVKEQQENMANISLNGKAESIPSETFGGDKINFVDCGCWLCHQHHNLLNGLAGNSDMKRPSGDAVPQFQINHANEAEPEERRMSDLSDWASSVTSNAEIQMNNFSVEQDILNLRKESEEKDATIKELTDLVQSSNVTSSKKISQLEDIIRRKNMIVTRLKKDMVVLEQKVVQLTRQKRSSTSASASVSATNCWQLPVMAENLVYDMDSTTSPSSSDSDSPPVKRPVVPVTKVQDTPPKRVAPVTKFQDTAPRSAVPATKFQDTPPRNVAFTSTSNQKSSAPKVSSSMVKPTGRVTKSKTTSPLRERSLNQKSRALSSLRQKQSPKAKSN